MNMKESKNENKITFTIIVNGQPTEVTANINAPLQTAIVEALHETGNQGQPPENWQTRDENGNLLDAKQKIGELGITSSTKLFLGLKAGIGG